ncbi:MAG: hypothetical protein Q8Q09_23650 [Deltaproteobacteria bacterium]|nr:hypothetical protein [Deltaproteobacteria bacterium]
MLLHDLTPAQALAAIRAMRAVAEASTGLHPEEQKLLEVSARALGLSTDDALKAPVISAVDLAEIIVDPKARLRVIQCMLLMSLMDGSADREEAKIIEQFASVLGVHDSRVESLRQLAEGKMTRLWLGLAWRSYGHAEFVKALRDEGPRGVWRMVGPMVGGATDYALARRLIATGELAEGTLGRAYFDFIRGHGFPFPGEPGGVPERGVWHDLTHVLAGYNTDPQGEVQNVCFIAGYRREDPFFWLFTIALQFHLGMRVSPYSPGGHKGFFEPQVVERAWQRGQRMRVDLSDQWDYSPFLSQPLDEVRALLGVVPEDEITL